MKEQELFSLPKKQLERKYDQYQSALGRKDATLGRLRDNSQLPPGLNPEHTKDPLEIVSRTIRVGNSSERYATQTLPYLEKQRDILWERLSQISKLEISLKQVSQLERSNRLSPEQARFAKEAATQILGTIKTAQEPIFPMLIADGKTIQLPDGRKVQFSSAQQMRMILLLNSGPSLTLEQMSQELSLSKTAVESLKKRTNKNLEDAGILIAPDKEYTLQEKQKGETRFTLKELARQLPLIIIDQQKNGRNSFDRRPVRFSRNEKAVLISFNKHPQTPFDPDLLSQTSSVKPASIRVTISRLREKLERDPKHPTILVTTNKGYLLKAQIQLINPPEEPTNSTEQIKDNPRTGLENKLLNYITSTILDKKRLHFETLQKELFSDERITDAPEGGKRLKVYQAAELKDMFRSAFRKVEGEAQSEELRSLWSEQDEKLWDNVQCSINVLTKGNTKVFITRILQKISAAEREFYKNSLPPENGGNKVTSIRL
ncbi:MAG: helix-turn-helix domain-containing protein [Candidatus Daviesbacteria bacterium]|nr:helix-turn-helix domain-containing protein [Candidatus Daviesbacteria bacterium]